MTLSIELHVTLPVPRIWRQLLDFWKIYEPVLHVTQRGVEWWTRGMLLPSVLLTVWLVPYTE